MNNRDKPFVELRDLVLELWQSDKITVEEKEWLDKMSIKRQFKFSEQERIIRMYWNKIGPLAGKIYW